MIKTLLPCGKLKKASFHTDFRIKRSLTSNYVERNLFATFHLVKVTVIRFLKMKQKFNKFVRSPFDYLFRVFHIKLEVIY